MSRSDVSLDDLTAARSVDIAEIPLIDFAPFVEGSPSGRQKVADEIAEACQRIGFFYLKNHGVPQRLIDAAFEHSRSFFELPDDRKAECGISDDNHRGWLRPQPGPTLSRNSRVYEQFRIQLELLEPAAGVPENSFLYRPNRWPSLLPGFRSTCEAYYAEMLKLSATLMHAFALGVGLPPDRFDGYFNQPMCQISLLYYPSLPDDVDIDVTNTVSHTDEGPLTILAQDNIGGLEVKRRDGTWIAAPPIEGAYTINVGDMMMNWTNGRYKSNLHRVRNKSHRKRYSIPFFLNPDYATVVEPLPEFHAADGEARYQPLHVGNHMSRFYTAVLKEPVGKAS